MGLMDDLAFSGGSRCVVRLLMLLTTGLQVRESCMYVNTLGARDEPDRAVE